ncbi:NUDIX domain-containing protein [Streptomyces sp. NPDC046915]|uniref:NUDIX domain-containing protein n=1 Tax=Streptomyces sp. NPDC046915 TaxID=3155257 RepID=UPI0033CD22EA
MTEPPAVELLRARDVRLIETPPPELSAGERSAMDRVWEEAVRANPDLFDGPLAALTGLAWEEGHALVLSWTRATYRSRALRRVPGATARLPSLFVSVAQPADDGSLLVGRMAPWTAAPGRWQLPGGNVEPPGPGEDLDLAALRRHAARELAEEIGSDTAPDALTLRLATRGRGGSVGVLFLAPPCPAALLHERYAALAAAEKAEGHDPEFDRITLLRSPDELTALDGPHVDYLEPVVRHLAETSA